MRAFNRMLRGRVPSNQRPLASIIKGMFTNGEQGAWYDPSDLSTLYQDAAGTIPVTAVEQPVGLMLDKSKGLVLGPELFTGVYSTGNSTTATYIGNEATATFAGPIVSTSSNWLTIPGKAEPGAVAVEFWATWVSGGNLEVGRAWTSGKTIAAVSNAGIRTKYTAFINSSFSVPTNGRVTFGASSAGSVWKIELISVRELPGNHASQPTATSRPVLSARVNLLTKTEDFSHSDWASSTSFAYEAAADPNGGNTATKIVSIGALNVPARDVVATANSLDFVLYLKPGTIIPLILIRNKTTATGLISLSTISTSGSNQYGSWVVTPVSDGWVKFKITLTSGFTVGNVVTLYYGATGQLASGLYWYIWHPDIRPTNTGTNLPDYQRVNTSTDYDTAGFPHYLKFELDDWLVTPSINFTGTDKMMVCAGVRRLADTASQIIVELGTNGESVAGSWFLAAQYSASYNLFANSLGVPANGRATSWLQGAAPTHDVVSFQSDLAGSAASDRLKFRRNGGAFSAVAATGSAGTGGAYGNYPLYIGRRAGASLSFNGHLYGLIIRGAATSDSQIQSVEKYINGKTRAY